MEQFMMLSLKWETITNWGCAPAPVSSRHWIYDALGWTDVHRKSVKVYGSTVTISHFGERFRGGQCTLVSFLFAPRCPACPAVCKIGGTPPCPVVPDPLSGAQPLGDGVGSGDLRDGSPSVWSRGKALAGMESGAPPFPAICKNGSTCPCALWSRRHCKWHTNGESCWCYWHL